MSEPQPVSYLLACLECGDPEKPLAMPFESAAARGRWAGEHTRRSGHDRWWVKDSGGKIERVTERAPAS